MNVSFSTLGIRDDEHLLLQQRNQAGLQLCFGACLCSHVAQVALTHISEFCCPGLVEKVTCGSQAVEQCVSAMKLCGAPHGITSSPLKKQCRLELSCGRDRGPSLQSWVQ